MPQIADIVKITGHGGIWTVIEPALSAAPPGRRWRCRQDDPGSLPTDRIAGDGDLELLLRPTLSPGMQLRYIEQMVTVVADEGERVKVSIPAKERRVPLSSGGHAAFGEGTASVPKGALVSDNANHFLQTQGA
jgi:hypothetical protein